MTIRHHFIRLFALASMTGLAACSGADDGGKTGGESGPNPFLQDFVDEGKADTGYVNPDGVEVEVDLEGDVSTSSYRLRESPAFLGQFATTYLRNRREFYLESLAEDSTSEERVEWLVDGTWVTQRTRRASTRRSSPTGACEA